jgi:STE24 endopeptidase
VLETLRQRLREAALADLPLRARHGVLDTSKDCPTRREVKHEERGTRVAVARLSHRAGVHEPPVGLDEVELRPLGREAAVEHAVRELEPKRDVAVPHQHERLARGDERGDRGLGGEDVLPDRVSRARVVEADPLPDRRRVERLEEPARLVLEGRGRPPGARGRVVRELPEVEAPEDGEIVVPDEAEIRALGDEATARVRTGPVPYEVPQAPDLVGRLAIDGGEHGFERMQVSVNVSDHARAHGPRATLTHVAVGVAAAALWAAAALLLARTKVPDLDLRELDPQRYFSPDELERADRFRTVTRGLWAGSLALELGVLSVLVWKGRPLAASLRRLGRGRVRTAVAVGLVVVAAVWVVTLPLGGVRHWWNRRYDLSRQGWGGWLSDEGIGLGLRAVLVSIAVAGAVFLAGRLGRRWWIAGGPALVALGALFVLAQPLVVQPLFNRFEPLPDRRLAAEVERLGERIGVRVETVQVADASRRTTAANAYVAGLGPTRRVVFYDTILDGRFTEGELVAVAAHELAHVARHHLWKGLAWFTLLAVPGVFVVAWATDRARAGGLRDPALVPLALLVALAFSLATLPLQNTVSRRYEAEADWIALTATRDPAAVIALDRRLTATSLGDPDPPAWARIVLSTHPPAIQRIAMAEAYRERESR